MAAFAFLVGGFTLGAVEFVDGYLTVVVLRGSFWTWGFVFEMFVGGGGMDGGGAVGVAVPFVGGIVLMVCTRVAGVYLADGVEEWGCVRFHFHLGVCATEGYLGGIGGVFVDEEVKHVDWLGLFGRYGGRRHGGFWGWIDECEGITGINVWRIFDVSLARSARRGCGDCDGFVGSFGGFFFVECALVFLCFRYA